MSALLVLGVGAATSSYAFSRVLETLLGASVGVLVSVTLVPPLHLRTADERCDDSPRGRPGFSESSPRTSVSAGRVHRPPAG